MGSDSISDATIDELRNKLLNRSLALTVAIEYAQSGRQPPLESINDWREAMGWHRIGSEAPQ